MRLERVAVIGATGQTGPHVVRALCDAGLDVIAIERAPHEALASVLAALPPGCARIVAAGSIRKYSHLDDPAPARRAGPKKSSALGGAPASCSPSRSSTTSWRTAP